MIDLNDVTVVVSNAEALRFPIGCAFPHFALVPGRMTISTPGSESWPSLPTEAGNDPNDPSGQAGTLWIFVRPTGGRWFASGAERLRKYQLNGNKPEAGDPGDTISTLIGGGWFTPDKFPGVIAGYNPKPGEAVGLCIVSGDTRLGHIPTVSRRSPIKVIAWPDNNGADPCRVLWQEGAAVPVPGPPPDQNPPIVPQPAPIPPPTGDIGDVVSAIGALGTHLQNQLTAMDDANERRYLDLVNHAKNIATIAGSNSGGAPKEYSGELKVPFIGTVKLTLTPKP